MDIRCVAAEDAEELSKVMNDVEKSNFMKYDPNERIFDKEKALYLIDKVHKNKKSAIFVAVEDNKLCGYLLLQGETSNRAKHRAYIVVGVHSSYRGKNIGTSLFNYAHNWAAQSEIHRLHLTAMTVNKPAIRLYEKMGYKIEGVSKHSLVVDGTWIDEFYMAKLL